MAKAMFNGRRCIGMERLTWFFRQATGGYMLAGYMYVGYFDHVDYVFKIDSKGVVQWAKTFGSQQTNSYATSIVETGDGFLISGVGMIYGDPSGMIIKVDWMAMFSGTKPFRKLGQSLK
ncbi:MAG: hypothetical protein QXZ68_05290 [Candidatus Bathyarchaeia archaeon]